MLNLINCGAGMSGCGDFTNAGFGGGGFGLAPGLGSGFGMSSPLAMGGLGMDPMSSMMQQSMMSMMSLMMGLMSQGMMGSLMSQGGYPGFGGMSPMSGMNPMFGGGAASSLGNIGRNFLGASPTGGGQRAPGRNGRAQAGGSRASAASRGGATRGGDHEVSSAGVRSMLKKAGSMVGLQEGRDRAKIQQITGKSGINPATTPWCAAFAMNLIKDYGLDDLKGLSNRNYCPTIESWARGKGKYGTAGKYAPKPGDAILFDWSGGKGTPDHIGIVEKVENGKVYTIEGNSSDSVRRKVYPLNSSVIDGYVITGKKKK